ncbi:MAG: hypothetical protein J6Y57_09955 [Lachnospiraceae bacterium]|nr:hypothetical protein [Lachnospiraceae bacterium]
MDKNHIGKLLLCVPLILLLLTACSYDPEKYEAENNRNLDDRREKIMEQMELKLALKYTSAAYSADRDRPFDVYDLKKGGNKSWYQYGVYPATATSYLLQEPVTFDVEIETDGKKFGEVADNYYGILYGDEVKEEVADLLALYPLEDVQINYEPSEEIPRAEDDLKKNLMIWGAYHVSDPGEIETLCDLADELNRMGCMHRLTIYNDIKGNASMGENNISSKEIRKYFE